MMVVLQLSYNEVVELRGKVADFWSSWAKPWTKKQCERRYVEGDDDIPLRQLIIDSGRNKVTIEKWSRDERWRDRRKKWRSNLVEQTRVKALEKTADILSDEVAAIATANYTVAKMFRDYARVRMQIYMKDLQRILTLPEDQQMKAASNHPTVTINMLGKIASRAMADIAANTGLKYEVDVNAAIVRTEQEGFVVVDPSDDD